MHPPHPEAVFPTFSTLRDSHTYHQPGLQGTGSQCNEAKRKYVGYANNALSPLYASKFLHIISRPSLFGTFPSKYYSRILIVATNVLFIDF